MAIPIIDSYLVKYYIEIILGGFNDVYATSESYNFKCNICGDSKKDKFKKRGYIVLDKGVYWYYCHNCQSALPVTMWMKKYYHHFYKQMIIEVMKKTKEYDCVESTNYKEIEKKPVRDEKEDTKGFEKLKYHQNCIDYCESRQIPKEVYLSWYYCVSGFYEGRIIITFRDNNGKIYYYQGRKFTKTKSNMKYLSRFGDHNNIYNYYNVDADKPVVILEGPIDSIFVENSIAMTGLKLTDKKLDKFQQKYFLLDNDESGYKKSMKWLEKGIFVFNWKKFLKNYNVTKEVKDVNDFIMYNISGINKLTIDMIMPYFTNNINDKLYFI